MRKCSQCGKETSFFDMDLFTGACRECRRVGARPASLGFGTLFLIAIVVALVTNSIKTEILETRHEVADLATSIDQLKKAAAQQTDEIRSLRQGMEARVAGTSPRK